MTGPLGFLSISYLTAFLPNLLSFLLFVLTGFAFFNLGFLRLPLHKGYLYFIYWKGILTQNLGNAKIRKVWLFPRNYGEIQKENFNGYWWDLCFLWRGWNTSTRYAFAILIKKLFGDILRHSLPLIYMFLVFFFFVATFAIGKYQNSVKFKACRATQISW